MRRMKSSKGMVTGMLMVFVSIAVFSSGSAWAGSLEPSAPPGPTMKTLDEIPPTWSQKLPAAQRFVLVLDGEAVLDKDTGLVWEKSPDATKRTWLFAANDCYKKTVGGRKGWRLPTVEELASLIDTTQSNPTLPSGHPFQNVQSDYYWSSTAYVFDPNNAYNVSLANGTVVAGVKSATFYMWAVRGGQGR
jgi:hypothetical protein